MQRLVPLAALMLVPLVAEAEAPKQNGAKLVECSGNTNITVSGRTGARTPFHGVFKIEGETVTMIEGDVTRFPRSYTAILSLRSLIAPDIRPRTVTAISSFTMSRDAS